MTPDEARRFFVQKVVAQAERESVSLSANERRMLDWSEVEPGCVADPELAEALASEISDEAYEEKICRLLEAAYEADIAADAAPMVVEQAPISRGSAAPSNKALKLTAPASRSAAAERRVPRTSERRAKDR